MKLFASRRARSLLKAMACLTTFGLRGAMAAPQKAEPNSLALAQGKALGLPPGIAPCPVAGWTPGTPGADHKKAALFAAW